MWFTKAPPEKPLIGPSLREIVATTIRCQEGFWPANTVWLSEQQKADLLGIAYERANRCLTTEGKITAIENAFNEAEIARWGKTRKQLCL